MQTLTVGRPGSPYFRLVLPILILVFLTPEGTQADGGSLLTVEKAMPVPIPASLLQILKAPPAAWRSPLLEVYRWDLFPDILVIDSIDFHLQDKMFTRLAYFLEKKGFRGKLMTNVQLAGRHGWNAHDYSPDGLSSFFNAASESAFPLNPEEKALEILVETEGILIADGNHLVPGRGGVLAISRSSSAIERRYLLSHESFHGIFFSSPEYREFCFRLWDSLPPKERRFYRSFLDSLGYDSDDRYLAVNEFQAYLMQQPFEYAPSYFERFLTRFGKSGALEPGSILAAARNLDKFLQSRFGVQAGETVRPVGQGEHAQ